MVVVVVVRPGTAQGDGKRMDCAQRVRAGPSGDPIAFLQEMPDRKPVDPRSQISIEGCVMWNAGRISSHAVRGDFGRPFSGGFSGDSLGTRTKGNRVDSLCPLQIGLAVQLGTVRRGHCDSMQRELPR